MGLMDTFVSAPGPRSAPVAYDPDEELAAAGLGYDWRGRSRGAAGYPQAMFVVAEQSGVSGRGEPVFGAPFRSADDALALSEDGYLINSQGQFVLGLPLDADGRRVARAPEILRISAEPARPQATEWIVYRANLPSYPLTANAEFDVPDSELLDKTPYSRDPSAQGSGIVLGDDRVKFQARSISGGAVTVFTRYGDRVPLVLRWAKIGSLRSAGCDSWNLFYRVRRDPRGGEVAWKNCGHTLIFETDGRLTSTAQSLPVFDVTVDGVRLGNLSLIFGPGGITQFADRTGLVKILEMSASGTAGGAFTGISMSAAGRLFAHYVDGLTRPVADVHITDDQNSADSEDHDDDPELSRHVA
jgi:flagellar hook protein FlgE